MRPLRLIRSWCLFRLNDFSDDAGGVNGADGGYGILVVVRDMAVDGLAEFGEARNEVDPNRRQAVQRLGSTSRHLMLPFYEGPRCRNL